MAFGDTLKRIRIERGLSQDKLAALLGTTKQVISRYETNQRVPQLTVVEAFARKLNVPITVLTGEASPMPDPIDGANGRMVPLLAANRSSAPLTARSTSAWTRIFPATLRSSPRAIP